MTYTWLEKDGFHRKIATWTFAVILTEIGGSDVKTVVLHKQPGRAEAIRTALADNPKYRFKAILPLTERDFERGEK